MLCGEREPIGTSPISCPVCQSTNSRRSRRRSAQDYLFSVAGIMPWRCETCSTRFHARLMPFRMFFYAHCRICGNLELQRISPEHVPCVASIVGGLLGIPPLRCKPCRHTFFSVRPLKRQRRSVAAAPSEQ